MVFYMIGKIVLAEAAMLLLPLVVALLYKETPLPFLITIGIALVLGIALSLIFKPKNRVIYAKEGFVIVAFAWIALSLIGCIPFVLSGALPNFFDAFFETVSGFTTTGASVMTDVESMPHGVLMWRSFTHWVGGMGVLVFLLAVIPLSGGSNINLMRAESPGPSVGKLVPKIKYTAQLLYVIYFVMTVIELIFLLAGHMPLFDALTTSFGTAGTGGFGIKNDSFMSYSPYLQWVVTIFMILFGVNFNAYYFILFGKIKKALAIEEVRGYFAIILVSTAIIFFNILGTVDSVFETLTHASFQVASIITTTGFSSIDFNLWPEASKTILVLLMFIGACAGSTGGGIKVSRIVIVIKNLRKELHSYIHPKSVRKIKFEGKPVDHDVVRSINVYFTTFIVIFVISVILVSLEGYDFTTNFTAVLAAFNNIGPGLSLVGPTCNFGFFNPLTKYVLMFDMLAGRLELFPLLILFHPSIWKELFHSADMHMKKGNK